MYKYKLTKEAVFRVQHPKNKEIRRLLALHLGVGNNSILQYLRQNKWDGPLTKTTALDALKELGLDRVLEKKEVNYDE